MPAKIIMTMVSLYFCIIRRKIKNLVGLVFAHWITDLIRSSAAIHLVNYYIFVIAIFSLVTSALAEIIAYTIASIVKKDRLILFESTP